ncbi:MAG: helix-turn-helix domain-containing protein, partial [Lachnospiraceae bacterium]|nr:helix-turn-helix domain-containing protein [Lachnospiraceae bacterium]
MDIQTLLEFGKTEQEHFHSEIELVYVLSGSISLYLTEQEYILEKNDVLLINSSKIHSWTQEGESLLCRVYFSYSYLKQMLQRNTVSFWCNSTVGDSEAYKDLRRILNDIAADQAAKRGEDNFQLQSLEYRLLNCLSENFLSVREDVFEYEVKDERIKDTIDYLNENYMNMLSVNMLASRVYMSESAFSRLFKRETDMTYMEYLNYVRMKYAVEALSDTGKTVTEIAQECGFSYSSSFNKIFRKEYGISPTQFRERLVRVPDRNRAEDIQNASALFHEEKEQPSVNAYAPDAGNAAVIVGPEPDITENGREANTGINIGHAQDLLYTEVRSHLDQLLHNCGFKYVRLHNPFADSMYYYPEEGEDYNFAHINNVFDYLVSSNVYPFIDLSNDPKHAWLNYGENL